MGTSPSLDRDAGFRQRRKDSIPAMATATATAGEGWRSMGGQRGQEWTAWLTQRVLRGVGGGGPWELRSVVKEEAGT